MKKLSAFTAMGFMFGLLCFGIGERVLDGVGLTKHAHARSGQCDAIRNHPEFTASTALLQQLAVTVMKFHDC